MKRLLIGLVFVMSVFPCHARLGETWDQCVARYDSPIADAHAGNDQIYAKFATKGFFIEVVFLGGISESETFYKFDDSSVNEGEVQRLLEANAGTGKWTRSKEPSVDPLWVRDDGAIASYDLFKHKLSFFGKKYSEMTSAEQDAKMKGF
jgi:hypothetical protein